MCAVEDRIMLGVTRSLNVTLERSALATEQVSEPT
jgi:hypothetical protein